ncbi:MAG: methyltransferase domain-containing protein [Promethearchaeota archaeon]|nr:MAG: methyltransferase domain-containing protein [Candidatus Lokiarchaeota archaeon]
MLKLNLGCGIYYKPGYVNIDKFELSVADQQADLYFLPYPDNSVDEIEASHIIEHFDIIHLPYILTEWWRVLKPGGKLFLEVPNLWGSVINLGLRRKSKKTQTIRFLFGVDMPGNFHKAGYTYPLLKKNIINTGFTQIKRLHSVSFHSESGIRMSAVKSLKKVNLIANFRLKVKKVFPPPNVMLYSAIESNVIQMLQSMQDESIKNLMIDFSLFHPQVAKILYELLPKSRASEFDPSLLEFMIAHNFPSLMFSNWMKWSKLTQNLSLEVQRFIEYWKKRILTVLDENTNPENKFSYLLSTTPQVSDIACFSVELLGLESQKLCNQAMKAFQKADLTMAQDILETSIRVNPSNELAYWNLARIYGIKKNHRRALEYYHMTGSLLKNSKWEKLWRTERDQFRKNHLVPKEPLQIRY